MHDMNKLDRLLDRWEKGGSWSALELSEFKSLVVDWVRYYLEFGNVDIARRLTNKKEIILKSSETVDGKFKKRIDSKYPGWDKEWKKRPSLTCL